MNAQPWLLVWLWRRWGRLNPLVLRLKGERDVARARFLELEAGR